MFKPKFPHFPRKISAALAWYTEKIGLWSLLSALMLANLYAKANFLPPYWDKLVTAIQNPLSINIHVNLAQSLWSAGLTTNAQNELVYASSLKATLTPNSQVLGASTIDPGVILNNWQHERGNLERELNYWQNIVAEKPDYRDAYLELAALAYRLSRYQEAKNYLDQALTLNPNNALLSKFSEIINEAP